MQGIYIIYLKNMSPGCTYSVAAVLYLQSVLRVMLFRMLIQYTLYCYISPSRSVCAVPSTAISCSSFISCFPGMLLRYYLSDFETVPVADIITSIAFAFKFHVR
jgi:hypothetical protein